MPITVEQESAFFIELKGRVDAENFPFKFSDVTIIRFLRGRKCNVENALKAIARHVKWRTEECVAEITGADIQNELKTGKIQVYGSDKNGRPVVYIFAHKHNKDSRDIVEMKKFIIFTLELALKVQMNPPFMVHVFFLIFYLLYHT